MILEIADIRIAPGQQAAFEEAIQRGVTTIASRLAKSPLTAASPAPSSWAAS